MRSRFRLLAVAMGLAAMRVHAQGLPPFPQEEVLVIVWAGKGHCSVLDRKTNCTRVASLMTGRLQVGRDRSIVVTSDSTDQDTMNRLAQVMTDIRAAGFRRVRQADPPLR